MGDSQQQKDTLLKFCLFFLIIWDPIIMITSSRIYALI